MPDPELTPDDIVVPESSAPDGPQSDALASAEEVALYEQPARIENLEHEAKRLALRQRRVDLKMRVGYSIALFVVLLFWLAFIAAVISATGSETCPFTLSDAVLIALIAGSTANVIGLVIIVAQYLFPKGKPGEVFGEAVRAKTVHSVRDF